MNDLVGIIRTESELEQALKELRSSRQEAAATGVEGHRQFNPGWHLSIDLRNMIRISRMHRHGGACASRKPRRSYPGRLPEGRARGSRKDQPRAPASRGGELQLSASPCRQMPDDLAELFETAPVATDEKKASS